MAVLLNLRRSSDYLSLRELESPREFVERLLDKPRILDQVFQDLKANQLFVQLARKIARSVPENLGSRLQMTECLYLICRVVKPEIVVETGVYHGLSTTFMLQALKDNGRGKLYSIEKRDHTPEGYPTGWLVPEDMRGRWRLLTGDSRELLPKLLHDLGTIDLFVHDSEHTYETMRFEYETAWRNLKSGGILLSDDVDWSIAFSEFAVEVRSSKIALALFAGGLANEVGSVFGGILKA